MDTHISHEMELDRVSLTDDQDMTDPDSNYRSDSLHERTNRRSLNASSFTLSSGTIREDSDENQHLEPPGYRIHSSLADLLIVLAKAGLPGPRLFKGANLQMIGESIGQGAQFTVYKYNRASATPMLYDLDGVVIKRANVRVFRENGQDLASGTNYRRNMMSLEAEIRTLCHPGIRSHRNIIRLLAWGYDYIDPSTPVPLLFVEAASMSLTHFMQLQPNVEVRYQICLDIAAGLEVLHKSFLVHGDIKPDNILLFDKPGEQVRVVAKLSDFGCSFEIQGSGAAHISINTYRGTEGWRAPELSDPLLFETRFGVKFNPQLMWKFDSYSYGLSIVYIFCNDRDSRDPPKLRCQCECDCGHTSADMAVNLIRKNDEIMSPFREKICEAVRGLLAPNPIDRPLPSPHMLSISTSAYLDWESAYMNQPPTVKKLGFTDSKSITGPIFWRNIDEKLLVDLLAQQKRNEETKMLSLSGEILFGLALALSYPGRQLVTPKHEKEGLPVVVRYIYNAAIEGYLPAQAICENILRAHSQSIGPTIAKDWSNRSLQTGYFLGSHLTYKSEEGHNARTVFQRSGGYCTDPFLTSPFVLDIIDDLVRLRHWIHGNAASTTIDLGGNRIIHAVAVFGHIECLQWIIGEFPDQVHQMNDNGETALYKACQAGQIEAVKILLSAGASASGQAVRHKITPLHWLFVFPAHEVAEVGALILDSGDVNINATILRETNDRITIRHFPFELPDGTPLHWASFARNIQAALFLLNSNANVDSRFSNDDPSTTPLAISVRDGDVELVTLLLKHGANAKAADSQGRTLLHSELMSKSPALAPRRWQGWIRHGNWQQHYQSTCEIVSLLVENGANVDAQATFPASISPVLSATRDNDGALTLALIEAGANVNITGSCSDLALHTWCRRGPDDLDYPEFYNIVLEKLIQKTADADSKNDFGETPFFCKVSCDGSLDHFRSCLEIFVANKLAIDINIETDSGVTPLDMVLLDPIDPLEKAELLLDHGATLYYTTKRGLTFIFTITSNKRFMDEQSATHIRRLLSRDLRGFDGFKSACTSALWGVCEYGRPKTLQSLLDLGLGPHINEVNAKNLTALDIALHNAELCREAYLEQLPFYEWGTIDPKDNPLTNIYDPNQGDYERAYEAYWGFPPLIEILLDNGAKRAYEINGSDSFEDIKQPSFYDLNNIYSDGWTPESQPHRPHWAILYRLEKFHDGWEVEYLNDYMLKWYKMKSLRPNIRALEYWQKFPGILTAMEENGWIKAIGANREMIEVQIADGKLTGKVEKVTGKGLENETLAGW